MTNNTSAVHSRDRSMLTVFIKELDRTWFGVAYTENKIAATALSTTKEGVIKSLTRSIPSHAEYRIRNESSGFAEKIILMLRELNLGNEDFKSFSLAGECISEPAASVLKAAASVPIGYVTSYGNLAKIAGTSPRAVGRIMAKNPIYPIVPCHRIVGSNFSLVGYGGRKTSQALQAKLAKLLKERRGFNSKKKISADGGQLTVYPVERVISKAEKELLNSHQQKKLN